jgi:AraC-like DNA-binding protein
MEVTTGGTHSLLPTATGLAARRTIAALRKSNIDPTPLLRHVGLFEQDLKERQDRVSAAAQARLLELAADALHDRALGFHLATETNPRGAGLLFYVASAAKDLGEAIELFARYCRIVNEAIRVQLRRRPNDLVVELRLAGVPRFQAAQNTEFAVAVIMNGLREIAGPYIRPSKITLVHVRNSDFPEFERFCGCPIEFGGSSDQLVFSNESLAAPLLTEDEHLLNALRPICDEAAKLRETSPGSLRALVEIEVQKLLPNGPARRRDVAKKLAMSTRTLARKLASEGTTFEDVVDELRRSLALQYITMPSISLSQIAWLLGYEGPNSFNHAFRRWTGGPPSVARVERLLPTPARPVRPESSRGV